MFDADEIEGQVKRTIDAINAFRDTWDQRKEAFNADYQLSMMRLMLGSKFDQLHWFVEAERQIIAFLEKQRNEDARNQMVNEVEELCK